MLRVGYTKVLLCLDNEVLTMDKGVLRNETGRIDRVKNWIRKELFQNEKTSYQKWSWKTSWESILYIWRSGPNE